MSLSSSTVEKRLVYIEKDAYDVVCGPITLEMSYRDGEWEHWNTVVDDQHFGLHCRVFEGPFYDWLESERAKLEATQDA